MSATSTPETGELREVRFKFVMNDEKEMLEVTAFDRDTGVNLWYSTFSFWSLAHIADAVRKKHPPKEEKRLFHGKGLVHHTGISVYLKPEDGGATVNLWDVLENFDKKRISITVEEE